LKSRRKIEAYRELKRILPIWFAQLGERKWGDEVERLSQSIESFQRSLAREESKANELSQRIEALRERYLQLGGNVKTSSL